MRRMYETEADIVRQNEILSAFADRCNAEWRPTPKAYPFDACMLRGDRVVAFAEVKARKVASDAYPSLLLSAHKWRDMVLFSDTTGVPTFLVAGYNDDVIRYLRVERDLLPPITFNGRADRGDKQDMEPMVELENRLFSSFSRSSLSRSACHMQG